MQVHGCRGYFPLAKTLHGNTVDWRYFASMQEFPRKILTLFILLIVTPSNFVTFPNFYLSLLLEKKFLENMPQCCLGNHFLSMSRSINKGDYVCNSITK